MMYAVIFCRLQSFSRHPSLCRRQQNDILHLRSADNFCPFPRGNDESKKKQLFHRTRSLSNSKCIGHIFVSQLKECVDTQIKKIVAVIIFPFLYCELHFRLLSCSLSFQKNSTRIYKPFIFFFILFRIFDICNDSSWRP